MARAETSRHVAHQSTFLGSRILGRVFIVVALLVAALIASILIEWIGIALWWPDEGLQHSADMVRTEMQYLALVGENNPFIASPEGLILQQRKWVIGAFEMIGAGRLAGSSFQVVQMGVLSALNMTQVFALRLLVMVLSLPVFLLFGLVGLVRGLVGRELRRWGGGRESSGMYHLYAGLMPTTFLTLWFLYLSMPVSINPFWMVVPAAALFAVLVANTAYRFQKHI